MDVARRCGLSRAWPTSAKARAIAARKVSDLGSDPRLLAKLSDELARWAARWWAASYIRESTTDSSPLVST